MNLTILPVRLILESTFFRFSGRSIKLRLTLQGGSAACSVSTPVFCYFFHLPLPTRPLCTMGTNKLKNNCGFNTRGPCKSTTPSFEFSGTPPGYKTNSNQRYLDKQCVAQMQSTIPTFKMKLCYR